MTSQGKRALVTGAATRVGRAIALALGAEKDASIAVHFRGSRDAADETCDAIRRAGSRATALQADLQDRHAARRLVDDAVAALGGLDLLVSSAASFERIELADLDDDAFDRTIELNLAATYAMATQAAPTLKESGGSMVFITCSSATTPFRNYLPYVVAKGALRQLMRTLALELAPEVRVNAVAPGTVLPPPDLDEGTLDRIVRRVPLRRVGDPADVAQAVLFLANSTFTTGHEIVVDGGRSVAAVERFG